MWLSVRPEIVDPETTKILLTSTIKYDEKATTKTSTTLRADVTTTITNYNTNTLSQFDGVFRFSKLSSLIDAIIDNSILSNITTLKIRKDFTFTLGLINKIQCIF